MMVELSLQEIFESVYVIESDAAKVWHALINTFP